VRRQGVVIGTALLLAACAGAPERPAGPAIGLSPALQELARTLPGHYGTAIERADGSQPLELVIERESLLDPERLAFMLIQSQRGSAERRFLLGLETADGDSDIEGRFAPVSADGRVGRDCRMQFQLSRNGFSGQTRAEECRFGEGDQATGLIKEIAFDGRQLIIGDRLVRLADGSAAAEDQVQAFFRAHQFRAWAGRREGESWRRSAGFELSSAGSYSEPADAAGMSLGFGIELGLYRMAQDTILRLSVIDLDSGDILGESWADPQADQLGLALPDLQVGLERVD
jgi:hypothetical protein